MEHQVVTEDLQFPEGPVWMLDGSVIVTEIASGNITRVLADGRKEIIASTGGGPNGGAIGPDGALYVCNNGGMECVRMENGLLLSTGKATSDYETGRIERVDLSTGRVERIYQDVDGRRLSAPNDIVFDSDGGFWFTDTGKEIGHITEAGGVFYAKADGSSITRVVDGVGGNGIGISPDGKTLYVAVTYQRLLLVFDIVEPGSLDLSGFIPGRVLASFPDRMMLDSLAMTEAGEVCVASIIENSGINIVDHRTGVYRTISFPDMCTTNICFGGADMRDAWVTQSSTGRLLRMRWGSPGLRLAHYA